MVRKKFFLFFMQEDLMNLFAKQEIETEMINKTTKFIKVCEKGPRRMRAIKRGMIFNTHSNFYDRPANRNSSSFRTTRF